MYIYFYINLILELDIKVGGHTINNDSTMLLKYQYLVNLRLTK